MKTLFLSLFVVVCLAVETSTHATTDADNMAPVTGSKLTNVSTRAFVQMGDDVMIGGFIVQGGESLSAPLVPRWDSPTKTATTKSPNCSLVSIVRPNEQRIARVVPAGTSELGAQALQNRNDDRYQALRNRTLPPQS